MADDRPSNWRRADDAARRERVQLIQAVLDVAFTLYQQTGGVPVAELVEEYLAGKRTL